MSAAGSDLLQQIQAVMALYTRGDEGQGGAVWRQRGTNDAQCVTSGGGYTSPRPGRDGRQIAVLRDGRPRILDLDTGEETPVPGTATYQRLYGWNEAAGTLLLQAGPQVVSVALADGSATPLAAVSSETGTQLDALTRLTPEGAVLLVRHTGGVWAIMERRPGEATGRRVVSRPVPLAEPAWSAAGVVFLAPPP
ncbi:hypothetical protein [Pararhodospirillum photometricum]|uniref:hypothetical protein n=1 Tax=Pararhodospirillum photometricum TaxID=1084 RepID=UPI00138AF304|nr:hypothetical protein [Pararhodospirillum photometricum]